jgi:hypothetical protein
MKFDPPKNINYAAQVVRVPRLVELEGLDNLVGVPILGHQALTQKGKAEGDLVIAFTAETALSEQFARENNLFREPERNKDQNEKGYLEKNLRIRAIKLRGHRSDALLMPLSSVEFTGIDWLKLEEGDVFDTLNGHEICKKYEVAQRQGQSRAKTKVEKAFKRVDKKLFPEHLETSQYWREKHLLRPAREVVITQKLHGTSIRVGRVPCLRQKGRLERFINRWLPTAEHTYDAVYGSRKVIKDVNNPNQQHFYETDGEDLWTQYGKTIADLVPEGFLVYAELIGWTPTGEAIQKGYTYHLPQGQAELYVYRVATINAQGTLADLSWDGVKEFCRDRGLKWTPELMRTRILGLDEVVEMFMDKRFVDEHGRDEWDDVYIEDPVPLSDKKSVDEGICLRQEGMTPLILKAKSGLFLQYESKNNDAGEADIESAA